MPYGQPVTGPGYQVTLYPAGHCLGAAQLLIELDSGQRVVYTGDFKLRPNPTAPAHPQMATPAFPSTGLRANSGLAKTGGETAETCPIIPCDILIMESTFGHPRYVFPTEDETVDLICRFVERCQESGMVPALLAYSLGKAQEALHHLLTAGYRVRYHQAIAPFVAEYQRWVVAFDGDHGVLEERIDRETVVLTAPGRALREVYRCAPGMVRTAFLSGWAVDEGAPYRFRADEAFPLSDHADYGELLRYATESGAREVYTVNGLPYLAEDLKRRGIPARHLAQVAGPVQLGLAF